jgi:iron complex transport system substrate-binding protein
VRTISDIFESINRLGKELNCQEAANKLLFFLKDKINTFKQRLSGRLPKKVLLLLGDSSNPARDLYAVGPGTFLNELLVLSGGKNILNNSKAQYPKLSKEFIIEQSPEIIIEAGPKSDLSQKEIDYRVEQWNRFPTIRAVRDKRIYFIGADYILIPGPRLVKILENFLQVIHPDLSNSQTEKITFQENVKP